MLRVIWERRLCRDLGLTRCIMRLLWGSWVDLTDVKLRVGES